MSKVFLSLSSGEVVGWLASMESSGGRMGRRVTIGWKIQEAVEEREQLRGDSFERN